MAFYIMSNIFILIILKPRQSPEWQKRRALYARGDSGPMDSVPSV